MVVPYEKHEVLPTYWEVNDFLFFVKLACRSEREVRAYDVCNLMTSHQSVSLAIKYASRSRRMALAQRLSEMASRLMDEEEDDEEEEDLLYHSRV